MHVQGKPFSLVELGLLVPAPTIGTAMAMVVAPGPVGQTVFVLAKAWLVLLPVAWFLWIDKGKPSWSKPTHGGFGTAVLLGVIIAITIGLAYWALGRHWIDPDHVAAMARQNGIGSVTAYVTMTAYWITINSLLEEYVWRWFVVSKCEVLMGPIPAIVTSAACFTIHHTVALNAQFDWRVTVLGSLGVFVGGMVWSWLYVRYRSVWPCYICHALVDIPIFVIGYRLIFP